MLMQVPHMNVMNECLDLDIELAYQTAILGLGDIVMPGELIFKNQNYYMEFLSQSYCFFLKASRIFEIFETGKFLKKIKIISEITKREGT